MSDTLDWNAKTIAEFRANPVRVIHRRSPLDHRNLVTTSHLPGGDPEHALNDQIRP
jgi:hypothetical protein